MTLPISPPLGPALARAAAELPDGDGWLFERKWDGFRTIVFVDGDEVFVQSRNGKPMSRYFPELSFPNGRYVLDGELLIRDADGEEQFETLQGRIHPAESRVQMLAKETPATFIAFDLLAIGDESLLDTPFAERRKRLEKEAPNEIELTPLGDRAAAEGWLQTAEGTMAKKADARYVPGKRDGMFKIKRVRTIDTVVVGWRPGKAEGTVGSLILRPVRPRGRAARRRPHLGIQRQARTRAGRRAGTLREWRARLGRSQPLELRARSGVALASARAGRGGQLRPSQRPPDPSWRKAPTLPRRP